MKFWLFSAISDEDRRWDDVRFISTGETVEDAARALVEDEGFLLWWKWDQGPPDRVWACPMWEPSAYVFRVDPENKHRAHVFETLWDDSVEIEVKL